MPAQLHDLLASAARRLPAIKDPTFGSHFDSFAVTRPPYWEMPSMACLNSTSLQEQVSREA
ncbi:hypothetical protein M378DRAFT_172039 [Amanita muscaria Koide BX008]|uniref:Uncharacterized protein n=1 Tax=Amanita muscaria (strain Koide BX008) TaxID=946122 RepID=A0A0C2WLZ2_AMAMK|nr:hypothetical protein M378DRAFT_172039 [Amanita muscaria Koide BX008]